MLLACGRLGKLACEASLEHGSVPNCRPFQIHGNHTRQIRRKIVWREYFNRQLKHRRFTCGGEP